jgi:hypothetical protein
MPTRLGHHVRLGAQVGAREKLEVLVVYGCERSNEVTGDANGGRRRVARAREENEAGGFIGPGARRGGCTSPSWPTWT